MRIASALDAWDGYGKCNCRADSFAVFENIIAFAMELFGWPRKQSVLVSAALIIVLSMPAVGVQCAVRDTAPGGGQGKRITSP